MLVLLLFVAAVVFAQLPTERCSSDKRPAATACDDAFVQCVGGVGAVASKEDCPCYAEFAQCFIALGCIGSSTKNTLFLCGVLKCSTCDGQTAPPVTATATMTSVVSGAQSSAPAPDQPPVETSITDPDTVSAAVWQLPTVIFLMPAVMMALTS